MLNFKKKLDNLGSMFGFPWSFSCQHCGKDNYLTQFKCNDCYSCRGKIEHRSELTYDVVEKIKYYETGVNKE